MQKTYEFTILFGIATDSFDCLGLIKEVSETPSPKILQEKITHLLPHLTGTFSQPYPPFSSQPVKGKPLYYWAREGKLDQLAIPEKEVTIHDLSLQSLSHENLPLLLPEILRDIARVQGTFRQQEIMPSWEGLGERQPHASILLATLTTTCSSGTYVRSLVQTIGEKLQIPALAYTIKRTHLGTYSLADAVHLSLP